MNERSMAGKTARGWGGKLCVLSNKTGRVWKERASETVQRGGQVRQGRGQVRQHGEMAQRGGMQTLRRIKPHRFRICFYSPHRVCNVLQKCEPNTDSFNLDTIHTCSHCQELSNGINIILFQSSTEELWRDFLPLSCTIMTLVVRWGVCRKIMKVMHDLLSHAQSFIASDYIRTWKKTYGL